MLDTVSALSRPGAATPPRRLAQVAVAHDLAAVRRDWETLLGRVACSPYQTPAWIGAWLATRGRHVRPLFGLGLDSDGIVIALLPLGLERRGGVRVARFLGGRDSNTGLGLFDPAVPLDGPDVRRLLRGMARQAGIDLYVLSNQPAHWAGAANPLLALPHAPSPSFGHEADLDASPEAFLARTLSKRARKHIRQKETKLAECGPVRHVRAETAAEAGTIVEALVTQRASRHGRDPQEAELREFLLRASQQAEIGVPPAVELHALLCGADIVATFAGASFAGHLSGMLISFADDPHWARFSPGDLLLARVMAQHCAAGTATFDLGVGEARYKDSFCPRVVPLFDSVLGMTWRGRLAAGGWRSGLAIKRRVKRSTRLWPTIARLRRSLASRDTSSHP